MCRHISPRNKPLLMATGIASVSGDYAPTKEGLVVSGKFALATDERTSVGNELMPLQNKPTSLRNGLPLGRGPVLPQNGLVSRD